VAVEDPGYAGLFHLLRALGLALRPVPIDELGLIPDALDAALREGVDAVVLTPRGQNPTGATLDAQRASELRGLLGQTDVLVIEDDHLGPIAGAPRLTVIGEQRRWAAARSVSKSLGPDLRIALLAGDARTISQVRGRQLVGPQWVSHLLQRLVVMLWSDRRTTASLKRAVSTYGRRRERFVQALAQCGIDTVTPAGLNVWVPVPEEAAVAQALLAGGWAIAPGTPFRLQSKPGIRVTISTMQTGEAQQLAQAIAAALRPQWRTRAA
jgi:DNA-binding transcriptional MocR family regulator